MDLSEEDISEFIALWKEEFKEDLTRDEARHCASQLLELYFLLAQPLSSQISPDNTRTP